MKIYIDDNYDKLPTIEKMTTEYFFSCADLKYLNTFYITPVISILSIVLNMSCFLTFANSTLASYTRSNMFKFLKCKALVDSLELSTRLAKLAYNNKRFRYTLVSSVLRILVGDYLKSVLSMLCIVTEILADLNRLFEMRNSKSAWRRVKTFRKQITGLVSITCFVYVYGLFEKKITVFQNEFNVTMYESKEGYFGNSDIFKYIKFTNGILRDIICVCVLIAIDCLILVEFRRVIQRKKRILSNSSSQSNCGGSVVGGNSSSKPMACMHHSISRVELAEKRLTQMILVKSAVRICGHMPYFFKYIPTMQVNMCFREISSICFITSDAVNIFIYYAYNRIFREYINSLFQMRSKRKGNQQAARKPARNTFHTDSFLNSSIKHTKNRPVQL